jgi:ParB family chromosome partitioning protein
MSLSDNTLGRSLSDVFAKTVRREPLRGYLEVDLGLILPPGKNPRTDFDSKALDELAASIRQHGVLQPIVVLKRDVGYEIISGERRWRAAKLAGLAKVPVVVRDEQDPKHVAELRLVENIQRENLNPIELARAFQSLLDEHGLTHDALADRVNKERSSITNVLRLLSLPETLQTLVAEGGISTGHAKVLLGLSEPRHQEELARRVVAEQLSVRELERLTRIPRSGGAKGAKGKLPHLRELEDNLARLFGTRVQVTEREGKGAITLHFADRDHFQRLVAIMDRFVKQSTAKGS